MYSSNQEARNFCCCCNKLIHINDQLVHFQESGSEKGTANHCRCRYNIDTMKKRESVKPSCVNSSFVLFPLHVISLDTLKSTQCSTSIFIGQVPQFLHPTVE